MARQVNADFNTGAYSDIGPVVARNGGSAMSGPYKIPHVLIDSRAVWTNLVPAGALRGFGVPQAVWAYESQMDLIAERLALDPVDFRRKNLIRDDDCFATGEKLAGMHYDELLDQVAADLQWRSSDARWLNKNRLSHKKDIVRRGKGLALVIKATITPSTSAAALKLNEDGSVNVLTSSVELGQGAKTVSGSDRGRCAAGPDWPSCQCPTRTPNLPPMISRRVPAALLFPWAAPSVKQRKISGSSLEKAAELLEASANDLVLAEGRVGVRGSPRRSLSYGEIVLRSSQGNISVGALSPHAVD